MLSWNYVLDMNDWLICEFFINAFSTVNTIQNQIRGEDDYQWWIGKNMEGRDCGLFQGTLPMFALINWG